MRKYKHRLEPKPKQYYISLAVSLDWIEIGQNHSKSEIDKLNEVLIYLTGKPIYQFCLKCVSDAYYEIKEFIKN